MTDYFIGLMSGTSIDAIDAVLVDFTRGTPQQRCAIAHPIPTALKQRLHALYHADSVELAQLGQIDRQLGELFAESVFALLQHSQLDASMIKAIGSHGQTIFHDPNSEFPNSLQIGCPHTIRQMTGITTVADFRRGDIAAGGQGAPITPIFHREIFQSNQASVILNIGGIANITYLDKDTFIGFDTGPGNTLLDHWIKQHQDKDYDQDGRWASSGSIQSDLLDICLSDPYFKKSYPKSTGREYFNLSWVENNLSREYAPEDVQATLTELTAITIANQIRDVTSACDLIICGGGVHNEFLIARLKHHLSGFACRSSEELGVGPDWIEAIAFAWFAKQRLANKLFDLKTITGSETPVHLGVVF